MRLTPKWPIRVVATTAQVCFGPMPQGIYKMLLLYQQQSPLLIAVKRIYSVEQPLSLD
jgi:hypothetical protein